MTNISTTASIATDASLADGRSSQARQPPKGSVRVIQASAVNANTNRTRFSSIHQAPGSGRSTSLEPRSLRVSHTPITGTITKTTGSPQLIHWEKLTSLLVVDS